MITRLHQQTPTNAATMLLLLFKVLRQQTSQTINNHEDENDVNMEKTVLDNVAGKYLDEDAASPQEACSPTQKPESEEISPKRDELQKKRKNKKKSLTTSDKNQNACLSENKTLVTMLNYVRCLMENDLFCSYELSKADETKKSSSKSQTSNESNAEYWNKLSTLSKEAASSKDTTLPKTVSLVAVCHEILTFFCQQTNIFPAQSAVTQHAIEILTHLSFKSKKN